MNLALTLMLVVCSILLSIASGDDFDDFIKKYNKKYTGEEKNKRRNFFNKNVDKIKKRNSMAAQDGYSYTYAINKLADMDQDEIEKNYMGLKLLSSAEAHRQWITTTKSTARTTTKTTARTTTPAPNTGGFGKN